MLTPWLLYLHMNLNPSWPDLQRRMCTSSLPAVFWALFLFSFAFSSFHPPMPSKLWYEEHPGVLQMFSLFFQLFWLLLTGISQQPCAAIPAPAHLFSHLLWHKGLFCLPRGTQCSNPGFLPISSEVILLSWLPLRICHPAPLAAALLTIEQALSEAAGSWIQRVVPCCSPSPCSAPGVPLCVLGIGFLQEPSACPCPCALCPCTLTAPCQLPWFWNCCIPGTVGTSSGHMDYN